MARLHWPRRRASTLPTGTVVRIYAPDFPYGLPIASYTRILIREMAARGWHVRLIGETRVDRAGYRVDGRRNLQAISSRQNSEWVASRPTTLSTIPEAFGATSSQLARYYPKTWGKVGEHVYGPQATIIGTTRVSKQATRELESRARGMLGLGIDPRRAFRRLRRPPAAVVRGGVNAYPSATQFEIRWAGCMPGSTPSYCQTLNAEQITAVLAPLRLAPFTGRPSVRVGGGHVWHIHKWFVRHGPASLPSIITTLRSSFPTITFKVDVVPGRVGGGVYGLDGMLGNYVSSEQGWSGLGLVVRPNEENVAAPTQPSPLYDIPSGSGTFMPTGGPYRNPNVNVPNQPGTPIPTGTAPGASTFVPAGDEVLIQGNAAAIEPQPAGIPTWVVVAGIAALAALGWWLWTESQKQTKENPRRRRRRLRRRNPYAVPSKKAYPINSRQDAINAIKALKLGRISSKAEFNEVRRTIRQHYPEVWSRYGRGRASAQQSMGAHRRGIRRRRRSARRAA